MRFYATDEVERRVDSMLRRRLAGEPVAYITGIWEFRGLPMEVNPSVLIPRVDTEVLAETAINWLHGRKMDARVLDLCSGSGCIGCAIADALPQTRVVLADVSPEAMDVSRRNVRRQRPGRPGQLPAGRRDEAAAHYDGQLRPRGLEPALHPDLRHPDPRPLREGLRAGLGARRRGRPGWISTAPYSRTGTASSARAAC